MKPDNIRAGMRVRVAHVRRNNALYGKFGTVESSSPTSEGWWMILLDDGRRAWLLPSELEPVSRTAAGHRNAARMLLDQQ